MFKCGSFTFAANFESGNLASVTEVDLTDGCTAGNLCSSCTVRASKPSVTSCTYSSYCGSIGSQSHSSHHNFTASSSGSSTNNNNNNTSNKQFTQNESESNLCRLSSSSEAVSGSTCSSSGKYSLVSQSHHCDGIKSSGKLSQQQSCPNNSKAQHQQQNSVVKPSQEFQLYTSPDCANTSFENNNRTWFFFSITGGISGRRVRLRIMNLNKQVKLYAQGMRPVWVQERPGLPVHELHNWTRIPSPAHCWSVEGSAIVSWVHIVPCDTALVTYYAFTFPYTYTQLQQRLAFLDASISLGLSSDGPARNSSGSASKTGDRARSSMSTFVGFGDITAQSSAAAGEIAALPIGKRRPEVTGDGTAVSHGLACEQGDDSDDGGASTVSSTMSCDGRGFFSEPDGPNSNSFNSSSCHGNTYGLHTENNIYYVRELVVKSLDNYRIDLLTITSYVGITDTREDRLPGLFPDLTKLRPHKFGKKKVIFVSARVHPGETPSSFVLNGFLSFITSSDPRACKLRDLYVFKLIPMLNPDGVVRGHYRTDQRGVNLNRVYGSPSPHLHPTIHAARALLLYYNYGSTGGCLPGEGGGTDTGPGVVSGVGDLASIAVNTRTRASSTLQPAMLDEDTCHSFGDAGNVQEAKYLGRTTAITTMEMDEPSASGWDVSSNLSMDSSIHTSALFRAPDMPDMHDDCSNISGVSEAETGVTSMFGALAAVVSDSSDSFASTSSPFCSSGVSRTEALGCPKAASKLPSPVESDRCSKCGLSKRSSFHKCSLSASGVTTRSNAKHSTSASSGKPSATLQQAATLLTEKNLKIHSRSTDSFVAPFRALTRLSPLREGPTCGSPCQSRLQHDTGHFTPPPPSFHSSLSSISSTRFAFPSSFASPCQFPPDAVSTTVTPSTVSASTGIASSSESEAEVGTPGKEGVGVPPPPLTLLAAHSSSPCAAPQPCRKGGTAPAQFGARDTGGLHMYVDLHGHASKRGIFLYGNWFPDVNAMVHNLVLAKLLALNCSNFDFSACNFTEKNMTIKDRRNGLSKEGSGRVAIMRLTGILRSYTLECNYNTGRHYSQVPSLPSTAYQHRAPPTPSPPSTTQLPCDGWVHVGADVAGGGGGRTTRRGTAASSVSSQSPPVPPKYTPAIFEECGRELAVSMLDAVEAPTTAADTAAAKSASTKSAIGSGKLVRSLFRGAADTVSTSGIASLSTSSSTTALAVSASSGGIKGVSTVILATGKLGATGGHACSTCLDTVNLYSRLPGSQYGSLAGVQLWLRQFLTSPSAALHGVSASTPASFLACSAAHAGLGGGSPHATQRFASVANKLSPLVPRSPRGGRGRAATGECGSPKQLRSRTRRGSWGVAVDAENREPGVVGCVGGNSSRPTSKYGLCSSPRAKSLKTKVSSPKRSLTSRALMFTDVGDTSCSSKAVKKTSKVRSKLGLTSNVSLTPNLNIQLSISDMPESPKLVKKVEKIRRERSKAIGSSSKKLKTGMFCPSGLCCPSSGTARPPVESKEGEESISGGLTPRSPLAYVFQSSGGAEQTPVALSPPPVAVISAASSGSKALKLSSNKVTSAAATRNLVKPLKQQASKRRPKGTVSRYMSQTVVSKSLDALPSPDSCDSGVATMLRSTISSSSSSSDLSKHGADESRVAIKLTGTGSAAAAVSNLFCCTQSSPDLAQPSNCHKTGRKKMRLKSGSGSEADLNAVQRQVEPLRWFMPETTFSSGGGGKTAAAVVAVTVAAAAVAGKATVVTTAVVGAKTAIKDACTKKESLLCKKKKRKASVRKSL